MGVAADRRRLGRRSWMGLRSRDIRRREPSENAFVTTRGGLYILRRRLIAETSGRNRYVGDVTVSAIQHSSSSSDAVVRVERQ